MMSSQQKLLVLGVFLMLNFWKDASFNKSS